MKTKKISLEEYLDFLHSGRQINLSVLLLNQILSIHGFKKIVGVKDVKRKLWDAVDTMNLIDPARSTLKESVNPGAFLELDEVIADLEALNWHDCCITFTQTLGKKDPPADDKSSDPVATHVPNTQSQKQVPKSKRTDAACTAVDGVTNAYSPSGSSIQVPSKRKRKQQKLLQAMDESRKKILTENVEPDPQSIAILSKSETSKSETN